MDISVEIKESGYYRVIKRQNCFEKEVFIRNAFVMTTIIRWDYL